tara:strand:+ start:2257 stop:3072 length:816 start_codon:yes stop_codon:yes gene_type:complete
LKRLREVINGDSRDDRVEIASRYRSGSKLVELFNEFARTDVYGDDFPSRWMYTDKCLAELNGTPDLGELMEHVFDPLEFGDDDALAQSLMYLNPALARDGYRLVSEGGPVRLRPAGSGPEVELYHLPDHPAASKEFIDEHISKCRSKLDSEDFSGAITNARSLVEAVLVDIEKGLDPEAQNYNGDAPRLQKRVHKLLGMVGGGEVDAMTQFLRGLEAVINGLAGTSNIMGDRHSGATIRADRRHARLAVNCSFALCDFYLEALQASEQENR